METNTSAIQALAKAVMLVVQAIGRTQKRGLKRLGYDLTAVSILDMIVQREPIHPTTIAAELDLLPSSVTRQVQALARAGYVAVVADPADRRSSLIETTELGRQELRRLQAISLDAFAELIRDWEEQDIQTLTTLLMRFAARLPGRRPMERPP
jgi:DNA-binding MarR family transcriptional regulator